MPARVLSYKADPVITRATRGSQGPVRGAWRRSAMLKCLRADRRVKVVGDHLIGQKPRKIGSPGASTVEEKGAVVDEDHNRDVGLLRRNPILSREMAVKERLPNVVSRKALFRNSSRLCHACAAQMALLGQGSTAEILSM